MIELEEKDLPPEERKEARSKKFIVMQEVVFGSLILPAGLHSLGVSDTIILAAMSILGGVAAHYVYNQTKIDLEKQKQDGQ
jgi:hypothetical protein